jgi:hypothetical protein
MFVITCQKRRPVATCSAIPDGITFGDLGYVRRRVGDRVAWKETGLLRIVHLSKRTLIGTRGCDVVVLPSFRPNGLETERSCRRDKHNVNSSRLKMQLQMDKERGERQCGAGERGEREIGTIDMIKV